ncbi:MAG: assimilatory sulfite reductase (NADPH) flavoprotein subunit [Salinibacter sp.]
MTLHEQNSPFNSEQIELLNRLLPTLSSDQISWLSGYLTAIQTGTNGAGDPTGAQAATAVAEAPESSNGADGSLAVTVIYGSATGNAQGLAEEMTQRLQAQGHDVTLSAMDEVKPRKLKDANYLLVLTSTDGDGEPPPNAVTFYETLHSRKAPKLEDTKFAVLALGDLSYEHFCKMGVDIDHRLEELGGERLHPRTDCDVDYEEPAEAWMAGVLEAIQAEAPATAVSQPATWTATMAAPMTAPSAGTASAPEAPAYSRSNPFHAEVLDNIRLNAEGSDKETRHLELAIEDSGLSFAPGDSLGIFPENNPELVEALIDAMDWDADELVPVGKGDDEQPLHEALRRNYEITVLTKPLVEGLAELGGNGLKDLVDADPEGQKAYRNGRDLLDLARDYDLAGLPAREVIPKLRKLPARLYSIANSYEANPDEVHLTIAAVHYQAHGRDREGVCSVQCAERVAPGDTLPVYVDLNPNFKPPDDPDAPIVMIGPGTGVAPFRAFLEEREETGASGASWLFFGERRFRTDFLYQTDWHRWLRKGVLARMDVAFSRDALHPNGRCYVQDRLRARGREVFDWLEHGAHLYVCGDEARMAPDVHAALLEIIQEEGGMNAKDAEAYLEALKRDKRYQRDVY